MNNPPLQPWARGPFELIRHANEHLKVGGDIDRRIAVIGFDNAIEVCIDVFINLHPRLRDGVKLTKEEVIKATQNYHTKIEFLDKYIESQKLSVTIPMNTIVWYHQLRNELYHSGNGMVPEIHVLEGSRSAAITVFNALFKVDISTMLGVKPFKPSKLSEPIPFTKQNDEMEFLRLYVEFERALENSLQSFSSTLDPRQLTVSQMWEEYKQYESTAKEWDLGVQLAMDVRNRIAHGEIDDIKPVDINETFLDLIEITDYIETSGKKAE